MRRHPRPGTLLRSALAVALAVLAPAPCLAQRPSGMGVGALDTTQLNKMMGRPVGTAPGEAEEDDGLAVTSSYVSIIDSAVPRNTVRTRLDLNFHNVQPTRAEFIQAKGGLPLTPGQPFPERRLSYQEVSTYAEFAPTTWLSLFIDTPYRWMNPDVNNNIAGAGDMNFGLKLCTWNDDDIIATLQMRLVNPTGQRVGLGTEHWTIEPGLLMAYRPYDNIMFDGELRYWAPLGGTDFAGDVLRYGLGLTVGDRTGGYWVLPVAEVVGWSVLSGKTMQAYSPDAFVIRDADGQTIVNGYLGLRLGHGEHVDLYAGYGRSLTGSAWQRDFFRLEFRWLY